MDILPQCQKVTDEPCTVVDGQGHFPMPLTTNYITRSENETLILEEAVWPTQKTSNRGTYCCNCE